jgi:hypothetical protein
MKHKKPTSILGLELTPDRLRVIELRAHGETVTAARTINVPMSLNVFTAEPELAGREVRAHLDAAELRTRACVLCLSADNLLLHRVDLTGVPEADVDSLLSLEAERVFPFPPEETIRAVARHTDPAGKSWATIVATASATLAPVLNSLRRAKLRLVSIAPGVTSLFDTNQENTAAVLLADRAGLQLAVAVNNAPLLLRPFHLDSIETDDEAENADDFQRELRITLRRLPRETLGKIESFRLFGSASLSADIRDIIREELDTVGLKAVEAGVSENGDIVEGNGATAFPALLRAASRILHGGPPLLEFWRPSESRWRGTLRRLLAKGILMRLAMAGGAALLIVLIAFAAQIARATYLEHRWAGMESEVVRLETIRNTLSDRRDWIGTDGDRLAMLATLVGAFPETGTVWAKSVEIRESGLVECSGSARSTGAYLEMLETLRSVSGVTALQVGQVKGGSPIQFGFQYMWNKDASND